MIIYGIRLTEIATEKLADSCLNCGTQGVMVLSVLQRYAHIFWIPLFPLGKSGVMKCSNCKQLLEKKEFDVNGMQQYKSLKKNAKIPIWTFAGLVIFIVLLVLGFFFNNQNNTKNLQLIIAPEKGDVYEIKNNYNSYTLYKVEKVIEDEVFLLFSEYETNKRSGLKELKLKGESVYVEPSVPVIKIDLKEMFDQGEIINIERR